MLVSSLGIVTPTRAHEVQPTVMDLTISPERIEITAEWMIEAAVAGLDLADLADTSDAENDDEYDRLRALPPAEMDEALRRVWPGIADKIRLETGGARLVPSFWPSRSPKSETPNFPVCLLCVSAQICPRETRQSQSDGRPILDLWSCDKQVSRTDMQPI